MTYQEQNFLSLLEKFKKEHLCEAQKKKIKDDIWRKSFITKYPRNSILSMEMNNYLIAPKKYNSNSFCRMICSELTDAFKVSVSTKTREDTFGIVLKHGTQLTLSKDLKIKFGNDYNSAFAYIKNEIVTLLDEVDKNNYTAIESCTISHDLKYMLLIIYCPEKMLPVCNKNLFIRYCERIGLNCDEYKEMIYYNNLLIQWKNDVPLISDWDYSVFISFCNWLYIKNQRIDGNSLKQELHINMNTILEEIDGLNLSGKSKKAVVKVRVNQGVFRNKLLQYFKGCCLCGASNKNLLIANHIKPWAVCKPKEKLDINNGFLMCLNHDSLFDNGWITFDDKGNIIIADRLSKNDRIAFNVKDNMHISLTDKNKKYLQYHREKVFENI